MMHYLKALGGLLLTSALVACGGGGGSPGTTPGSTPAPVATQAPAALEVFTSSPELSTAANSSVTFNVTAKDANNVSIPDQTVTFTASSGSLSGASPSPRTGPNGEPITTVSLTPGADRTNRDITVTVRAGSVTQQIVVPVTGTELNLSGSNSLLLNASTQFTVKAVDSAGTGVPGARVTVTSATGNTLAPTSLTTDTTGAATFTVTGSVPGSDTVTVAGLGASATAPVFVSGDQFGFVTPASGTEIVVNTPQQVTVEYKVNNVAQVGRQVTFSTTRGTLTPTTATTDAQGRASATVSSTSSGPANIVAQIGSSAQVTLPVAFRATTPATLVLQANPGSVRPNTSGSTTNQSALQATVRDAAGNPVSGVAVNFTAVTDPSNGSISPGTAVTDASGNAVAQFIAGPISTANNGVVLRATVQGTSISGQATLTVNAAALFIAINTGNTIDNVQGDDTSYQKPFSVSVTDANGAPSAGTQVTISVFPTIYRKGRLVFDALDNLWVYQTVTSCPNEDLSLTGARNGILDPGEDFNGNGRLEPGIPVLVATTAGTAVTGTVTTDGTGRALFNLQYGENFVPWLNVEITARAGVQGTESVKTQMYDLRGISTDFSTANNPPAGVLSPFGQATSCDNPN